MTEGQSRRNGTAIYKSVLKSGPEPVERGLNSREIAHDNWSDGRNPSRAVVVRSRSLLPLTPTSKRPPWRKEGTTPYSHSNPD